MGETKLFVDFSEIHSFNIFIVIDPGTILGPGNTMINQVDKI